MRSKGKADDIRAEGKPALVPKLRFPEFREARGWEVKAVGDVFRTTRGHVLPMSSVKDEPSPSIPYPVYSSQTKNGGLAGYFSSYLFEDAITWTTDGANAGDVNFRSGRFYCTNVCGVLVNLQGYANACVAALLNSVTRTHVSYVGNPKLMNGVMERIEIPFPQLAEQQKIAECLTSLDELIAAQARKVNALKKHKKGLMQDLFPREGETQPRRRFPEFQNAGKWEVRSIGQLGEVVTGSTPSTARMDYYGGDRMFVSPADISDGRFIEKTKTTLTNIGFVETRPIRANSVLFVCIGSTRAGSGNLNNCDKCNFCLTAA
jgi:type I restriction enzyme S subunit